MCDEGGLIFLGIGIREMPWKDQPELYTATNSNSGYGLNFLLHPFQVKFELFMFTSHDDFSF